MKIRPFIVKYANEVVSILKLNNQYLYPDVDGPEAMRRIMKINNAIFLVACNKEGKVVGMIRGVWDGSRALIHQISVHPKWQRQGIGTILIREIAKKFKTMGAPSLSVLMGREFNSLPFFEKLGFESVNVELMVAFDINLLTEGG